MVAETFKKIWRAEKEPLTPISAHRLAPYPLQIDTVAFLTKAGLPHEAAPFLTFVRDVDDAFEGISCLTELVAVPDVPKGRYIVIGQCNEGNLIAVDTHQVDQVVELDREQNYKPYFFNTSVHHLAGCLVAYRDFVATVNEARGEGAYLAAHFTDAEFARLKKELMVAEPAMARGDCFWTAQLESELEARELRGEEGFEE
jgi:hypothetical protein